MIDSDINIMIQANKTSEAFQDINVPATHMNTKHCAIQQAVKRL